jgi:hypothetical protein
MKSRAWLRNSLSSTHRRETVRFCQPSSVLNRIVASGDRHHDCDSKDAPRQLLRRTANAVDCKLLSTKAPVESLKRQPHGVDLERFTAFGNNELSGGDENQCLPLLLGNEKDGNSQDNLKEGERLVIHEKIETNQKRSHGYDASDLGSKRLWLDPSTPLVNRVNRILTQELGTLHPLDITLASVDIIRECGQLKSFEGMSYAHDVLERLLEEKRHVNSNATRSFIRIPERVFQTVMYGWAKLGREAPASFAPQKMREVINLMIQEADYDEQVRSEQEKEGHAKRGSVESTRWHPDKDLSGRPTVTIYNTLLQGLAEVSYRSIAAAIEAATLLDTMDKIHQQRGWHTKPNTRSFTLVINAFARTKHPTSGSRAEAVLRTMIDYHRKEKERYAEAIGVEYNTKDPALNKRKIVTPDVIAYSGVIQAYANSGAEGSAEKAHGLLRELLQSDELSPQIDEHVFTNTIHAYAKMAATKGSAKARVEAAERAEEILWLMVEHIKGWKVDQGEATHGRTEVQRGDISARRKARAAGETATQGGPLSKWGSIVVPFNATLNAWSQSGAKESPERAEGILQKMLDPDLQETTGVQPDSISFNTCLNALARASRKDPDAPWKAEGLLKRMIDISSKNDANYERMRPDVHSYTTVMNAHAQSNDKHKAVYARRLFVEMVSTVPFTIAKEGKAKNVISAVPFTVLLNAAIHSPCQNDVGTLDAFSELENGDSDAYSIALETYRELCDGVHNLGATPDHFAFAAMLEVLVRHTDPCSIERRQRVEGVFEDACAVGQVSSLVLKALEHAAPSPDFLDALLSRTGVSRPVLLTVNALPREWTRHVPQNFRTSAQARHFQRTISDSGSRTGYKR